MKEDSNEDEKTTLISYVNKSDIWIINISCSNHMTSDKSKIKTIGPYKGSCVSFGNNVSCLVKGKGSINLVHKIKCDNAYSIRGLNYNLLSVSQLKKSGYGVEFHLRKAKTYHVDGKR